MKHVSYHEANFCTPVLKICATGERNQSVSALCLYNIVTGELLLRQKLFQLLEQIVIDCSMTTLALMRRCAHNNYNSGSALRCLINSLYSPDLAPTDCHLVQHPRWFLTKQHLPSDDDVQADDCQRLAPLSGGEFLRHRFTEIDLTV
ncbi:hypothetical protein AVEN_209395-1 [Araneus ventricosus]|uniref:Uncharacterized protein n=1 Tax=Araneus ventricosus TaxID=182803 RepID=A0A4Y2PPH3_ARAVE|nr:hypothetical protein AVEN_209395-1 [Araneus ventricosus]